jgi:hypothetical protein
VVCYHTTDEGVGGSPKWHLLWEALFK